MESTVPPSEYLTTNETANLARVSTKTIKRWVKEGRFPVPVRVGQRKLLWPAEVVRRHLERLATQAGSAAQSV